MKTWFEGFTKEELDIIKCVGSGSRQRERMASMSPEERETYLKSSFHSDEAKGKSAESSRRRWADKTPEVIQRHIKGSFDTPEAHRKSGETRRGKWRNVFGGFSEEEKREFSRSIREGLEAFWNSPRSEATRQRLSEAGQESWASKTPEERKEWLGKSCHSEEARRNAGPSISRGLKEYYAGLTKEERLARVKNSVDSDEANLKSLQSNHRRPNWPEIFLGVCLEKNFPGEWAYNGDGNQGVVIGGRTPDFINIDGQKAVIEVFGGYWHQFGDEDKKIEHYARYGYKCLVVWNYEGCLEEYIVVKVKELAGLKAPGLVRGSLQGPGPIGLEEVV